MARLLVIPPESRWIELGMKIIEKNDLSGLGRVKKALAIEERGAGADHPLLLHDLNLDDTFGKNYTRKAFGGNL